MKDELKIQQEISKELQDFYYNHLKFCACGRPQDTLKFIKDILNEISRKYNTANTMEFKEWQNIHEKNIINICGFSIENDKYELTGNKNGLYLFVLYYLNEIDILEHGGSVGGSWLTGYGEEILDCLNKCDNLDNVLN